VKIEERRNGAVVVFEVHGALTSGNAETGMRHAIRGALDRGARAVVVNLQDVSDIDSSGVADLASAHIAMTNRQGRLLLCSLSKKLEHIFLITRLAEVFEVHATEAEATASLTQA
jgi:anti-sigma B factor antagonist